ncbi:hypothetical protein BDA99DRAFT_554208 [Phascolomyces articulosus]|uniref:Arrestin-like N-terminal domain-containing protein n=1 Tax=Phascolomyces articulosus TaxID=60185 RepID=A0AAD5PMI8_9FUNG|nr:hypothetical protein BDA99DRAFT_554208 [Phascolomyces articulosus]
MTVGLMVRPMRNKDPVRINIKIDPQYHDGGSASTVRCYPGSVFEGQVELFLEKPLDVEQIRLVFRGTEIVNYGAMGRSSNGDSGLIFGVRTTFCASQTLDPGYHRFPFLCQMPMVNFPPSFNHALLATTYTMTASVNDTYKTQQSIIMKFEPHIETSPYAKIRTYAYNCDDMNIVLLSGLHYQLHRDSSIRIKVMPSKNLLEQQQQHNHQQSSSSSSSSAAAAASTFTMISASLKRCLTVDGVRVRPETFSTASTSASLSTLIQHATASSSNDQQHYKEDDEQQGEILELQIPETVALPTVTGSSRFGVTYKIVVSAKVRCGPMIMMTRKLFEVPIHVGTMPHGTRAPDDLLSYADKDVMQDMTTRAKPRLNISPSRRDSLNGDSLPVYSGARPPPYYPQVSASSHFISSS